LAQVRVCAIVELELRRLPPATVAKLETSGILAQLQVEALDSEIAI